MNINLQVIKGLLSKEAYNKYSHWIKPDDLLKKHYDLLGSMHDSIEGDITLDEYLLRANQQGLQFINELKDTQVGSETLSELIRIESERSFCHRLGLVCMEAFEGRKTLSDVSEVFSQLENIEKVEEIKFITDSFEELAQSVHRDSGIKWRLPSLQEALGSLNKGDFGFIFARPETGKTTFLASEISYFVEQVEGPIVWFNNEERGDKVKTRVCQANLGLSLEDMFSNLIENEQIYLTNTKSLVKIYDKGFIHKREVEKVVKQLNPSLVIFDQIDKIKGFKADREDLKLGAIYMWARELAKDYCPVIGVCQAAASAENKRWLDMDDVAKSKTEKAAEADFIIGIGKRNDIGEEETRFLHLIKNKLTGIHARITCRINPTIARYTDI